MIYDPIHNKSKLKDYFIPALILFFGLAVSTLIFWSKNASTKIAPSAILPLDTSLERANIIINPNDPIIGNPMSAVTIVEFYDYQCGFCKVFAEQILPKITDKYIKTGKAKIVFKDLVGNLGSDSKTAAVAANCAFEQNKFLEYHDDLFAFQDKGRIFSQENILNLAQKLNLDIFKFNECVGLEKNKKDVEEDTKEGKLAGSRGTPTIFINGIKVAGVQSFLVYQEIIEEELKSK